MDELKPQARKDKKADSPEKAPAGNQTQETVLKTFLAECEHIHNKVLFDCINDSLL